MSAEFIYRARTPEQWDRQINRTAELDKDQVYAVKYLCDLEANRFFRGYISEGEWMHGIDCWDDLKDLSTTEVHAAFDAEYKRMAEFEDPEFWSRFMRWQELRSLASRTAEQEAELRLIEVERVLDGAILQ